MTYIAKRIQTAFSSRQAAGGAPITIQASLTNAEGPGMGWPQENRKTGKKSEKEKSG